LDSEERYIIEGLRSGRENAYRKLFDQYYRRLVVFANKYLGDMESARDIVQDLFVDLYDSRQSISMEPRVSLSWQFLPKHNLSAGFGIHSRRESFTLYTGEKTLHDGKKVQINKDLELAARGYSGLYLRPRDRAKFGLLYLNGGLWEESQLISKSWVTTSTSKHILRGDIPGMHYGYQWWVHEGGLIAAVGFGGQILMLVPEYDLMVLFNNYHNEADGFQMETPWCLLDTFIIPSIAK
jgi:hypothetical protein